MTADHAPHEGSETPPIRICMCRVVSKQEVIDSSRCSLHTAISTPVPPSTEGAPHRHDSDGVHGECEGCAPPSPVSGEAPTARTAWLIERGPHATHWWCDTASWWGWTHDANLAIRFATREQAEAEIAKRSGIPGVHEPFGRATEHVFLDNAAPSPSEGATPDEAWLNAHPEAEVQMEVVEENERSSAPAPAAGEPPTNQPGGRARWEQRFRTGLARVVTGALRSAINDHGPIDKHGTGSAAKRVIAQALAFMDETQAGLPAPLTRDACDVCGDPLAAHPRLYCADKIVAQLQAALSAERAAHEQQVREIVQGTARATRSFTRRLHELLDLAGAEADTDPLVRVGTLGAARLQAEQERDAMRDLAETLCASETLGPTPYLSVVYTAAVKRLRAALHQRGNA